MISLQNSVFDQCRQQRGRLTSFGEQWKPAQQTKAVDDQESEDEHQDIKKNINNKSNRNFQFFVGKAPMQQNIQLTCGKGTNILLHRIFSWIDSFHG